MPCSVWPNMPSIWHLKFPSRSKAFAFTPFKVSFTDILVDKSVFRWDFCSALIPSQWHGNRPSKHVVPRWQYKTHFPKRGKQREYGISTVQCTRITHANFTWQHSDGLAKRRQYVQWNKSPSCEMLCRSADGLYQGLLDVYSGGLVCIHWGCNDIQWQRTYRRTDT